MKIKVTIELGNAAFTGNQGGETARILRDLANKLEDATYLGGVNTRLMDSNGNRVGEAVVTGKAAR